VKTKDEAGTPGNVAGVKLKIRKEQFLKKYNKNLAYAGSRWRQGLNLTLDTMLK